METSEAVAQKKQSKLIVEFQKTLGETVVLLLELKTKTGISKTTKLEIDATVEELQKIIMTIPDLVAEKKAFSKVFDAIKAVYDIWCRVFT